MKPKRRFFEVAGFSFFDLRNVFWLLTLLLAWQVVSLDFSAFPFLSHGADIFSLPDFRIYRLVDWWRDHFFDTVARVHFQQIPAAILLVAAAISVNRVVTLVALIPLVMLDLNVRYREPFYDLDYPAIFLILMIAWPGDWRLIRRGEKKVSLQATGLGFCLMAYVGFTYFLAGCSKFTRIDHWVTQLELHDLYAAMKVWCGEEFPGVLEQTARFVQRIYTASPFLERFTAVCTLVLELGWILGLVVPMVRWVFPLCMLGFHLVIFLGSGILFLSLTLVQCALGVPWRKLFGPSGARFTMRELFSVDAFRVCLGATLLAVWMPVLRRNHYPPFIYHAQFAWHYKGAELPQKIYRLGYFNPVSSKYNFVALNYGGFIGFQEVIAPKSFTGEPMECFAKKPGAEECRKSLNFQRVSQYAAAVRTEHSNRWLLGNFAVPEHIVSESPKLDPEWLKKIYLVVGEYNFEKNGDRVDWAPVPGFEFEAK